MGIERIKKIGEMDAGVGEARIDVVLCQSDGVEVIALQLSTWEEALGWQVQKTIPLAADKIRQLQRLLVQTRNQIEEQRGVFGAIAQVIDLPLPGQKSAAVDLRSPRQLGNDELLTADLQG
ncbi:MAG: hypothetical protein L0220_21700 [Acidobacteria bacterium]|nr:hypothetical protein [Acidobacteriota bacterium]